MLLFCCLFLLRVTICYWYVGVSSKFYLVCPLSPTSVSQNDHMAMDSFIQLMQMIYFRDCIDIWLIPCVMRKWQCTHFGLFGSTLKGYHTSKANRNILSHLYFIILYRTSSPLRQYVDDLRWLWWLLSSTCFFPLPALSVHALISLLHLWFRQAIWILVYLNSVCRRWLSAMIVSCIIEPIHILNNSLHGL